MKERIDDTFTGCWDKSKSVMSYLEGKLSPNFPLPTVIGEVMYLDDKHCFEIIICDADHLFDPRLWIGINKHTPNRVHGDYPHDSPNYR